MTNITTKSGAEIVIRPASFKNAMALKNAVMKELSSDGVDFNMDFNGVADIVPLFAKVDSSEAVQSALFACLATCSYNKAKINLELFDDHESARSDYYEIIIACAKENLSPFFKNLLSGLGDVIPKMAESLKQK